MSFCSSLVVLLVDFVSSDIFIIPFTPPSGMAEMVTKFTHRPHMYYYCSCNFQGHRDKQMQPVYIGTNLYYSYS